MKKAFSFIMILGIIYIIMSSCKQNISDSSLPISSEISQSTDTIGKSDTNSKYHTTITIGDVDVSVISPVDIKMYDAYMDYYHLIFNYEVGILQGQANIPLSYGQSNPPDPSEVNFFDSMSLRFIENEGRTSLTVEWMKWKSSNIFIESVDTFIFDEINNFWYYLWPDSEISPVILNDQDVIRLFPDEKINEFKYCATFFPNEPIYDVSFYRVSDFDNIYGPDVLLAYYDEYKSDNLFFWQTDSMYSWHVSIQYTDKDGNIHIVSSMHQDFRGLDTTNLFEIDQPDWNTDVEGEIYIESFY